MGTKLLMSQPENQEPVAEAGEEEDGHVGDLEADPVLEGGGLETQEEDVVEGGEETQDDFDSEDGEDPLAHPHLQVTLFHFGSDRILHDSGLVAGVQDDSIYEIDVFEDDPAEEEVVDGEVDGNALVVQDA